MGKPKVVSRGGAGRAKTTRKRGGGRGLRSRKPQPSDWFRGVPVGGGAGGIGACVLIAEGEEGRWDVVCAHDDRTIAKGRAKRGEDRVARAVKGIASKTRRERLSATLAALAQPTRVSLVVKLLEGPATYRALQKVSGAKAGPLYHHINQLRLAGLIMPKERDLYALTRGGRNVVLGSLVLMSIARDSRERPVVGGG